MTERRGRAGRRPGLSLAAGLLVLLCGTGCFFSRTIVNENVRNLDPARLTVGESDIFDVVAILGVPAPRDVGELGTLLYSDTYLRYVSTDEKCFSIGLRHAGISSIPLPLTPFVWCYGDEVYELSFEFDEDLGLRAMHVTERDTIWSPFQGTGSLDPVRVRDLSRGAR